MSAFDHDHGRDGEVVTSLSNPTIRLARGLHHRRRRYRERALLIEGTRAVETALEHGARPRAVLIDSSRASDVSPALLEQCHARSARVMRVSADVFVAVAETEQPQALIAICDIPERPRPQDAALVLALDGVRDPGNLGTLVRSAAAAGADALALLPGCVDPWNAKTVRASAGFVFALPILHAPSISALSDCFSVAPILVLADQHGDVPYDEVDWTRPMVLLLGGEASGAGPDVRTYADIVTSIPMATGVDSLNVGVAGSVLLFEWARRRRRSA